MSTVPRGIPAASAASIRAQASSPLVAKPIALGTPAAARRFCEKVLAAFTVGSPLPHSQFYLVNEPHGRAAVSRAVLIGGG